jgi:hypothetical protein
VAPAWSAPAAATVPTPEREKGVDAPTENAESVTVSPVTPPAIRLTVFEADE